jgi:hypothetical protein
VVEEGTGKHEVDAMNTFAGERERHMLETVLAVATRIFDRERPVLR